MSFDKYNLFTICYAYATMAKMRLRSHNGLTI